MSALREWAASASSEAHKVHSAVFECVVYWMPCQAVKVNSLGKWKTVFQLSSCTMLMACRQPQFLLKLMDRPDEGNTRIATVGDDDVCGLEFVVEGFAIGSWLFLWCAAVLAVLSLSRYMSNVWSHFRYPATVN